MSIDIARWPCHLRQFSKIGTLGSPTRSNYDALELNDSHEDFGRDTGSAVWPDFSMLKAQMNTSLSLHFMTFLRVRSRSLKWISINPENEMKNDLLEVFAAHLIRQVWESLGRSWSLRFVINSASCRKILRLKNLLNINIEYAGI